MKKFLSFALVAMLIVATVAVSVSALTWKTGEGLWVHEGASYGDAVAKAASPVVLTNVADTSVTVEQGGYWKAPYTNGGVWTNEAVGLDGLSVEVTFEKAPIATNDCWFAIHLLDKPTLFTTNGETLGYKNLIRFADPKMEYYSPAFGSAGSSEVGANDGIFGILTGDVLTMDVRFEYGQYIVSYTHKSGDKVRTFEVPADKTLDASNEVFNKTGKAHLSICGSLLGAESDWKYSVKVTEGKGLSAEEIASIAFEQSKGSAKADIVAYTTGIAAKQTAAVDSLKNKVYENDTTVTEALANLEAAVTEVAAAEEALKAADSEETVAEAVTMAEAAQKKANDASAAIEQMLDMLEDKKAEDNGEGEGEGDGNGDGNGDVVKPETKSIPWLWIGIAAAVVVIIVVVAVVLGKKKKQ